MDPEELQREILNLVEWLGPNGEQLFNLSIAQERMFVFNKIRDLIVEKDAANDQIAVEILSWAWQELSK